MSSTTISTLNYTHYHLNNLTILPYLRSCKKNSCHKKMATTTKSEKLPPHLALFPCAGMGHLIPFLRLAAMFASRGCTVTVITVLPTVSTAESDHLSTFFAIHPNIKRLEFHLLPYQKSKFTNEDPFFIQMESINNSVHLLCPLLSSLSPSLSAIVADFPVTATVTQLASELSVSVYTVITTSARFFTLMAYLPQLAQDNSTKFDKFDANSYIEIPSLGPMAVSNVPPIMLNKNHFFAANISSNISSLFKTKGVLINTFNSFESEAIEALRRNGLTQIQPNGPFESFETGPAHNLPWLDEQAQESVVFISFGSRTASLEIAMSLSNSFVQTEHPRLVFLPSGVGNSTPFFRLAVMLASHNCRVTFINVQPQTPEFARFASFFNHHPRIEILDFELQSHTPSDSTVSDPFIIHIENINRSLYQLIPILSSSQISAIFSDFVLAATLSQISADLNIPFYLISTTSAQFFSVIAYFPFLLAENPNVFSNYLGAIEIPGLAPIPKSNIPPTWMHESTNFLLTAHLLPNARSLTRINGVFLNTFNWFKPETIAALNSNRVLNSLPPVFPIGPMQSYHPLKSLHLPWLSEQPAESVVYVNFGIREVMSTDQIRELREGLEICGYNYLWVMKDDNGEFSGDSCLKGTQKGEIIRGRVDREKVLAHPAIGGFVNQCEWDSVIQAAWHGVPILAWPQHGDQKMNAEIVEKVGLGIWMKEWGWGGEKLVAGKEIGRLVAQIMGDLNIKKKAKIVREKAREACEIEGSSEKVFLDFIKMFTSNGK